MVLYGLTKLLFLIILKGQCDGIHISQNGYDHSFCGKVTIDSCKTIEYVMKNRVAIDETLILAGGAEYQVPAEGLPLAHSLTVRKRNGDAANPKIVPIEKTMYRLSYFLKLSSTPVSIQLQFDSIDFENVTIFRKSNKGNVSFTLRESAFLGYATLFQRTASGIGTITTLLQDNDIHFSFLTIFEDIGQENSELIVKNCNITSHPTKPFHGHFYSDRYAKVVIENSNFISHVNLLIWNTKQLIIRNTDFKEISTNNDIILNLKRLKNGTLSNCTFSRNTAKTVISMHNSMNVHFSNLKLLRNTVKNAIYVQASTNVPFTNLNFSDNTGLRMIQWVGGGDTSFHTAPRLLKRLENGTISNCNFLRNTVTTVISVQDSTNVQFSSLNFTDNTGKHLIQWVSDDTPFHTASNLNRIYAKNNTMDNFLHATSKSFVLENSIFMQNKLQDFGIHSPGAGLVNVTFSHNYPLLPESRVYLVYLDGFTSIENSIFDNNQCHSIIRLFQSSSFMYAVNVTIINNTLKSHIIDIQQAETDVSSMHMGNNKALTLIAANKLRSMKLYTSSFSNNWLEDSGIVLTNCNATIENTTFDNVTAKNDILDVSELSTLHVQNVLINAGNFKTFISARNSSVKTDNATFFKNSGHSVSSFIHYQQVDTQNKGLFLNLTNIELDFKNIMFRKQSGPIINIESGTSKSHMSNVNVLMNEVRGGSTLGIVAVSAERTNTNTHPNFLINCSKNYNPESISFVNKGTLKYELFCQSCPKQSYSTRHGFAKVSGITTVTQEIIELSGGFGEASIKRTKTVDFLEEVNEVKSDSYNCSSCPPGGLCEFDFVSRDNFYGILSGEDSSLSFLACPDEFCCSSLGNKCSSYNTCNNHREGTLCGECSQGYHLSYFSNLCEPNNECTVKRQVMFWLSYAIAGLVIGFVLIFIGDIVKIPKRLFAFIRKKEYANKPKTEFDIPFTVVFNIILSFYQLQSLMFVQIKSDNSSFATMYISSFFNLDLVVQQTTKICPAISLTQVTRGFFKNFMFLIVMLIAPLLSLIFISVKKLFIANKDSPEEENNHLARWYSRRFITGYLLIITFGYKNIVNYSLSLMNCININSDNFLYISAEVKCFNYWQILNFVFLLLWILPFPAVMVYSFLGLRNGYISSRQFLLCLSFPVSIALMLIWNKYRQINKVTNTEEETENTPKEDAKMIERLKEKYELPYREHFFWWEAWVLYERVIVSVVTIFILDPVIRLCALAPCMIFFLWLHYFLHPYKTTMKLLTFLDITSYIFLCLHLVSNMFRSVVYDYNLPLHFPIENVFKATNYFEQVFTPLWALILFLLVQFILKKCRFSL